MTFTAAHFFTAFEGQRILKSGDIEDVAGHVKQRLAQNPTTSILMFSDSTGKQTDIDLRGSQTEVPSPATGPGRPKLGVVAREISLLPRHWEWLATQSGGASAAIRRLIDDARKTSSDKDRLREAQERAHHFMTAMAGDLPNYEDALRALYANNNPQFRSLIDQWPVDIRQYTIQLATPTQ